MTAEIIDGKAVARRVTEAVAARVQDMHDYDRVEPGLAVVLVGDDPASQVYVRMKKRKAEELGIRSLEHNLPVSVTEDELLTLIEGLNDDRTVHGILVQLPLPAGIDQRRVLEAVRPDKDVDGFHPLNVGRLVQGADTLTPCTPYGCLLLLRSVHETLSGKQAVVLGRSNIVGRPMAQLLLQEDCTVTVCHSRTRDLAAECRRADILVAAVGRPGMVAGDWIKPGATVIDVGTSRLPPREPGGKDRLKGDVEFDAARMVAGAITPVPGGVGPMTIACLMRNTVIAAARLHKVALPEDF